MRARSSFATLLVLVMLATPLTALHGAASAPTVAPDATAPADAAPDVAPGNDHFQRTWQRTDAPVADGSVARTWMWGPEANTPVMQEAYAESPGGERDVQYYDKTRMEITHPDAVDDGVWYVTNGLLVVEMMTGQEQTGDNSFTPRAPSTDNVAGDADDPTGPTYTTFAGLRAAAALPDGATITQRVARDGTVTDDPSLAAQGVTVGQHVQVPGIDHQIAAPFWDFMTSSGLVDENGQRVTDSLFPNPFYATGYPETEPYWATVKVAGTYRLVLMQCFERRCLTYTPGNPAGFVVEAGNVGQHYHHWRYATASSVVINEVMFRPLDGQPQWVELANQTSGAVALSGAVLTNAAKTRSVTLPDWNMPAGSYLVVAFDDGANDADFSDGGATFHAGAGNSPFFDVYADGAALYLGGIVDFIPWSYGAQWPGGAAATEAVAAGIWSNGAFFAALPPPPDGYEKTYAVEAGQSIGRDAASDDGDTPSDWRGFGGADAWSATPAARNEQGDYFVDNNALAPQRALQEAQPKRAWTIMWYVDARDFWAVDLTSFVEMQELERNFQNDGPVNVVVQIASQRESGISARRWQLQHSDVPDAHGRLTSPTYGLGNDDAQDPGDPNALAQFITWAKTNYPADHYAIILSGHGDGWKALFPVRPTDNFLRPSELSAALAALGTPFDDVFFSACMMSAVEIGDQIAPQAIHMVASEEVTWGEWPWTKVYQQLVAKPSQLGEELATTTARLTNEMYVADAVEPTPGQPATPDEVTDSLRTIVAVDLSALATQLTPAVDQLSLALKQDISDLDVRDQPSDNGQILIRTAQEATDAFTDDNFKDLRDFARHILAQPALIHSQQPAQAIVDLLKPGPGQIVLAYYAASAHAQAGGLSIYFPHDEVLPEGVVWPNGTLHPKGAPGNPCQTERCRYRAAFDDPLYDPTTSDTVLYQRDPFLLVPQLRSTVFPMRDDPGLRFVNELRTHWGAFLHRFYQPVADACIRVQDACVSSVTVNVGDTVTLSGAGSSDSDGPESNDVPAHTSTPIAHYYWDMNTAVDHPGGPPNYVVGKLYTECGTDGNTEDCDRDSSDTPDDDLDLVGKAVTYTCATAGTYHMRLMVWDEEHDLQRVANEEIVTVTTNNVLTVVLDGTHWRHFNVDSATVTVTCKNGNISRKTAEPDEVGPGDTITYTITLPANDALTQPAPADLADQLPALLTFNDDLSCSLPGCAYDPQSNLVTWAGVLQPGQTLTVEFTETLPDNLDTYPNDVQNCADVYDGAATDTICAPPTTIIEERHARKTSDPTTLMNAETPLTYTITVPANANLTQLADASIADPLPDSVQISSDPDCDIGTCDYDPETRTVRWDGALAPGGSVTLTFQATLVDGTPPAQIENCAQYDDGLTTGQVCATTTVDLGEFTAAPQQSARDRRRS